MNTLASFFDWILTASLRASVLVPVVLAVQFALRRRIGARTRYALWLPVLVVLLTPVLPQSRWSVGSFFAAEQQEVSILPPAIEVQVQTAAPVALPAADPFVPVTTPLNWREIGLWTWLGVSAGLLLVSGISHARALRRFRFTRTTLSEKWSEQIAQMARAMGLRSAPRVWHSTAVASPAVTGLWRPVLLLPSQFERDFTTAEARLILQHELMHLKRHDLQLNALLCALLALHWFNPLLWLAFLKARVDCEAACDAQVLENAPRERRIEYGHALLKAETVFSPARFSLGFLGIFQRGAALRARIQYIAIHQPTHPAMKLITSACIVLLTFFGITRAAPDTESAIQVEIEARFIELTGGKNQSTSADDALTKAIEDIGKTPTGATAVKALLDDAGHQLLLRRIGSMKGVDLMAVPRMLTRSGQRATVEVTREFISPPSGKPVVVDGPKVGVTLDVLPTLASTGTFELQISSKVVEFDGFVDAPDNQKKPVFNERKAEARTTLQPGHTALIDIGSRTDTQNVSEEDANGKIISQHQDTYTRRAIVLITARIAPPQKEKASSQDFTPDKSAFRSGDDIRITKVRRTGKAMTVEADYVLASAENALILLSITSSSSGDSSNTVPVQSQIITKGRGSVLLHLPEVTEGLPHVSFYDTQSGQAIGGVYFGTQAEAEASKKLNLNYMRAGVPPETKLRQIILPEMIFNEATLEEALEFLRAKSRELDTSTNDPEAKGVNIMMSRVDFPKNRITLDLTNVPLLEAVRYVTELAGSRYLIHNQGVYVTDHPDELDAAELVTLPFEPTVGISASAKPVEVARSIILPKVELREATIEQAADLFRDTSREADPTKKGVQIRVKPGAPGATAGSVTLSLNNVSVIEALIYAAELAGCKMTLEGDSFVFEPLIRVDFPNTSLRNIRRFYGELTGKKMILDAALQGETANIIASRPLAKQDAINFIHAGLLLNGYAVIPVDDSTVKLIRK